MTSRGEENLDNVLLLSGFVRKSPVCHAWILPAAVDDALLLRCAGGALLCTSVVNVSTWYCHMSNGIGIVSK